MSDNLRRRVLLGVTGGIAAYKTPELVRALVKAGAEVQVVMTPDAHDFVSPLVLSVLSGRTALTDLVAKEGTDARWNNHVHMARWADVMLIAPTTVHTLGKMAHGLCDNLLMACWLSAECPVFVAPAMDLEMYRNPATARNLARLAQDGVGVIGPEEGELASGLHGPGRMTEPTDIVEQLAAALNERTAWAGRTVLVTAGPTREAIDPVRFISNRSTGKMGFAIAEEAAARGARVVLITGPVTLKSEHLGIERIDVGSAAQMAAAAEAHFDRCDVAILSAAVADWKPASVAQEKMKKTSGAPSISFEPTKDILAWMGQHKHARQVLVGFAMETENALQNAESKLERKNLDLIVLNSLRDAGAGFAHDTNKVTLIDKDRKATALPLMLKEEVARAILDRVEPLLNDA